MSIEVRPLHVCAPEERNVYDSVMLWVGLNGNRETQHLITGRIGKLGFCNPPLQRSAIYGFTSSMNQ